MQQNKLKFTILTDSGESVELAVKRPDSKIMRNAQIEGGRAFSEAIQNKYILSAKIDDYLREQDLWNDDKEAYKKSLEESLAEGKKKLATGGIKLSEAREIALEMRETRQKLRDLLLVRTELEGRTAEGQAENARLNYLICHCTVYNSDGKPYYKSLDDYYDKAGNPESIEAATKFVELMSGTDLNIEDKLPENQFLKKYKFVDAEGRLVNKDGHLIDLNGRLINENGRYVNASNELVDINGNKVDEDGNLLIDFSPFLDDNGEPMAADADVGTVKQDS